MQYTFFRTVPSAGLVRQDSALQSVEITLQAVPGYILQLVWECERAVPLSSAHVCNLTKVQHIQTIVLTIATIIGKTVTLSYL